MNVDMPLTSTTPAATGTSTTGPTTTTTATVTRRQCQVLNLVLGLLNLDLLGLIVKLNKIWPAARSRFRPA